MRLEALLAESLFAQSLCISGALKVHRASDVTLRNITVRNNVAKLEGGGVCLTNSVDVKIQDVRFSENTAGMGGGALLVGDSKKVFLKGTEFVNNVGNLRGGAIQGQSA